MDITGDKDRDKQKKSKMYQSGLKRYMNKRNKRFVKGDELESKQKEKVQVMYVNICKTEICTDRYEYKYGSWHRYEHSIRLDTGRMESKSIGTMDEIIDIELKREDMEENEEIYVSDEESVEEIIGERLCKHVKIRATLSLSYMIQGKRDERGERQTYWMRSNEKLRDKFGIIATKYGKEIEKEILSAIDEVQSEDFPAVDLNALKIRRNVKAGTTRGKHQTMRYEGVQNGQRVWRTDEVADELPIDIGNSTMLKIDVQVEDREIQEVEV
jgi:hypothetical protein